MILGTVLSLMISTILPELSLKKVGETLKREKKAKARLRMKKNIINS